MERLHHLCVIQAICESSKERRSGTVQWQELNVLTSDMKYVREYLGIIHIDLQAT